MTGRRWTTTTYRTQEARQNSPETEPTERALMRGIGLGIKDNNLIAGSSEAANVLKPLAEILSSEYLDNEVFEAWITPATMPATEGRFTHHPITIAYTHDGEIRTEYIEDGVPDAPGIGENGQAISRPPESVYADPDERELVTGHEYRKALEMAQNGQIEQEGRVHPVRAISSDLLSSMRNMVDSAFNDGFSTDEIPPDGLVTHVSQEFGKSVEAARKDVPRGVRVSVRLEPTQGTGVFAHPQRLVCLDAWPSEAHIVHTKTAK